MAQGIALEKLSTHLWVVIQKNKMVVFNFRRKKWTTWCGL
jgi:hypothetical protein